MLREYRWSSYRSYAGVSAPLAFVDPAPILALTDVAKPRQRRAYRKFVEAGVAQTDEDLRRVLAESALAVGAEAFRQWVHRLHGRLADRHGRPEDVSFRRQTRWMPVEDILVIVCGELGVEPAAVQERRRAPASQSRDNVSPRGRSSLLRPIVARMLCKYGGLTQRQAAPVLNLRTGAAVGAQIKRLAELIPRDRKLRRQIQRIERSIEAGIKRSLEHDR